MKIDTMCLQHYYDSREGLWDKVFAVGSSKPGWVCSVLELLLIAQARVWWLK
jgi:hypothetical protein